jgi:ABC-2 type transport system permease protein
VGNTLPAWLTVLTRLDPVSYGIDSLRRTVLGATGVPRQALDRIGLSLFGHPLTRWIDVAVLVAFGAAMLAFAILGFRQRD